MTGDEAHDLECQLAALAVLKERAKTHKEKRAISAMMCEALASYDIGARAAIAKAEPPNA